MKLLVVVILLFLSSDVALSYPDNIRLGYQACSTCHVDGNGGGLLTLYGRSLSEEMATWAFGGEGQITYSEETLPPEGINAGGDVRYLSVWYQKDSEQIYKHFVMQAEFELELKPASFLSIVGSTGVYGPLQVQEFRKHYLQVSPVKFAAARVGRFEPPFGLRLADHKIATAGQGLEQYGAEVRISGEWGEIAGAGMVGPEIPEEANYEDATYYLRSAYFFGKNGIIGTSVKFNTEEALVSNIFGAYSPLKWIVLMGEAERDLKAEQNFYFARAGIADMGLFLYGEVSGMDENVVPGFGLRWIPRPHSELTIGYGANQANRTNGSYVIVYHLWL